MGPAMPSAEIQFAQRLASSEKGVRDRAARKLRQYLSVRTQRDTGGFSQEELLALWRGLFCCVRVPDEPPLQEELANTISQLIHVINNSETQHLFIQTFWQTMNREWQGIDAPQLDKYYMLIRLVLRQSFHVLKESGWEESQMKLFLDVLMKEVLCPENQSADGVRSHFIDIYLNELSTVGGKELLADQNLKFIDPFCRVAAKTKDHTLVQTIARGVFEVIVDQSAFVPEETMEDEETQEGNSRVRAEEAPGTATSWSKAASGKNAVLGECFGDGAANGRITGNGTTFRSSGSPLQFDYKAIADRLLEITSRKNTPPFNRKHLCKLVRKFQDLSEAASRSQLSFTENISDENVAFSQRKPSRKRKNYVEKAGLEKEKGHKVCLAGEEHRDSNIQKRKRKKKKKKSLCQSETQGPGDAPEAHLRQALQPCASAPTAGAARSGGEESSPKPPPVISTHAKRNRAKRKNLRTHRETWESAVLLQNGSASSRYPQDSISEGGASSRHPQDGISEGGASSGHPQDGISEGGASSGHPQGSATLVSRSEGGQVRKRKRKLSAPPVNGGDLATPACPSILKVGPLVSSVKRKDAQGTKLQKRVKPSSPSLCDLPSQKMIVLKKRKKMKEVSNLPEHNGVLESKVRQIQALGSSGTLGPLKKPLRTEDDFVKFDTPFLPKPLFFRRSKSNTTTYSPNRATQLSKTPPSSKKVTFGLSRNMTAEFKKTDKSILVSPTGLSRVAFNPEQRPLHGVLKSRSSSPAGTPLATKKPLTVSPKRRPRAADFF